MGEMHDMYGAWDNGEFNPLEGDSDPIEVCVNCDEPFESGNPKLFCSDLCQSTAQLVRYVRRCRSDGRIEQPDVREAIDVRIAHILGGGYDSRGRTLSPATRTAVFSRDHRACQLCGEDGTEIHHLDGSSDSLENLQLLCYKCHMRVTKKSFIEIGPEDDRYEQVTLTAAELHRRFDARLPLRDCDDPDSWPTRQRQVLRERRERR
jgi:5-methylcytosine-specific restriction endonuclease McrA